MKLLEMLYNHFEGKWPRRAHNIGQDRDGVTWLNEDDTDLFISTSGIWSSTCFDSIQLDVAEDYATSVITKKMFKEYCKKQKEKQMNKVFTEAQKIDIVGDFLNNHYDSIPQTEFARLHGTSSRSLGRWIDKYADLVLRKVPTDAVRGTKENPFQIGDMVEVGETMYLTHGYTNANEYYGEVEVEGRGVIMRTDYNYPVSVFPDVEIYIDGTAHTVEICHVRYVEDIDQDDIDNDTVLEIKQDEPIYFTGTSQSITLYRGEESVTVHKDQKTYPKVVQVLLDGELEEAWTIGNVKETLEKFSEGSLVVNNGVVTINGFEVVNDMSNRLIDMLDDGTSQCAEGIKVFARFFENLMNVQDKRIVDELYLFLRHNDIKLNADGSFTGYKAVNRDYKDHRTNRIDNSPGNVVTMPRSLVNDDKYQACSTGLHVGSYDYVKDFGGQWARFVAVKVFPEDVVSVPIDYNGGKLRACKYEVIEDVTDQFID